MKDHTHARTVTPSPRLLVAVLGGALAIGCKTAPSSTNVTLTVAAASDLGTAFREVGEAFEKETGSKVTFTFGSSGLLSKQIAEGAPYDLFAAANVSYVDDLVKQGAAVADSKALYGRGRIVTWVKNGSGLSAPADLAELADGRFTKIAIANPEHAPYGRAAKQALTRAGVWETVKPKLVYGENVQQTLQFAQTGNADAAIVARSIAMGPDGSYAPIAEDLHDPLDQALVICSRSAHQAVARAFATFVGSSEGRAIMRRSGFLLPGETAAASR